MPEEMANRPDFAKRLSDEIGHILTDPAFERAPTQSRLLRFLTEQSISKTGNLSQFSIAVDGLGRPGDYDLTSDSYPRVQMSRLRRNLLAYYSRNAPNDEYCVYIRSGEYRLRLAPIESAYPEIFKRGHARLPLTANHQNEESSARKWNWAGLFSHWSSGRVATFTALFVALVLIALIAVTEFTQDKLVKPAVGLLLTVSPDFADQAEWQGFAPDLQREAENYIAKSFVASFTENGAKPDYLISMNFGTNMSDLPDLRLLMKSADGRVIYSNTIPTTAHDRHDFIDEVSANLTYMLSPNGALAHDQMRDQPIALASDYGCFLSIEINRAAGTDPSNLVDKCLDRFPHSEYRSYWFARKALSKYTAGMESGMAIESNERAWDAVQLALRTDRYNAFANYIAAKVESARGNCDRADIFAKRALERGVSYPALIAGTLAEAAACGGNSARNEDWGRQIRTLARTNPDPDPLLKLHLILATLAIDEPELARDVASSLPIENAKGEVGMTGAAMSRALSDPAFLKKDKAEIVECISLFIWNKEGQRLILAELERNSTSG